jgi:hypothetical protein
MPIFMIERRFAEEFEPSIEGAGDVNAINDEEGVRWLYSFLAADKRKTYCLYEAISAEAIVRAAERAGLPADVIVEVGHRVNPIGMLEPIEA